jgi:hypothetical protein
MRFSQGALVLAIALACVVSAVGAKPHKAVTGMELASFDQREVLVIRTTGDIPVPGVFSRDEAAAQITFSLQGAQANSVVVPEGGMALIKAIALDSSAPGGVNITITLSKPELSRPDCFRLSQPSQHVILFEAFKQPGLKDNASLISNPEQQLSLSAPAANASTTAAAPAVKKAPAFDPDKLGIVTLDLRQAEPSQVLGLAAESGLLQANGRASVATENLGTLVVRPGGQSIASWVSATPPGEIYLAGKPQEIANFMRQADAAGITAAPSFEQYWSTSQNARPAKNVMSGRSPAMRSRMKDDPYGGMYYANFLPGGTILSDVRVTLPAISGMNLYQVLDYLSTISGISLIIDPYAFDAPTGGVRPPKVPQQPPAMQDQAGFRRGEVFDPQVIAGGGTVIGNFIDVPFDAALRLILETQQLEFVVYDSGSGAANHRYGKQQTGGGANGEQYGKPVILVTSRERVQQELSGTNEIDLYQMHYADPGLVTNMLANFNLLPGTDTGWYIYGGQGSGGQGGGGNQGGGGSGGNGGNRGGIGGNMAGAGQPGGGLNSILVYRGSNRAPVQDAVMQAIADGKSVVRVVLRPETSGQFVTLFAQ